MSRRSLSSQVSLDADCNPSHARQAVSSFLLSRVTLPTGEPSTSSPPLGMCRALLSVLQSFELTPSESSASSSVFSPRWSTLYRRSSDCSPTLRTKPHLGDPFSLRLISSFVAFSTTSQAVHRSHRPSTCLHYPLKWIQSFNYLVLRFLASSETEAYVIRSSTIQSSHGSARLST